jgi:FkbM family methyltransferase
MHEHNSTRRPDGDRSIRLTTARPLFDDHLDWQTFWKAYAANEWEPETRSLLEETLRPGDLFVDVGAWIGPVSAWAQALGADVIAIEPDPTACAELRTVVPGAEIWEGAVTPTGGRVHLKPGGGGRGSYGDSMSSIGEDGLEVAAWTLPEILKGRVPALVKMDVEGYEMELCPQVAPWLAARGVPLQVSFHGTLPDPSWFADFGVVEWPAHPQGDLVARP